jgi:transcriptional regulator with XRE-family HTH domain
MVTVGSKKLAAKLRRLGLSERLAAQRVGCSRAAMHRYIAGERAPTGPILFRVCDAFKLNPRWFFAP